VVVAGFLVAPGPDSGQLAGSNVAGMGTNAIGSSFSIQNGVSFNESMVFEIFRSDGVSLSVPEGAINMRITVLVIPTSEILLSAEDKLGNALGSATTMTAVPNIDVSALIPGEIHRLTVEATSGPTILRGVDYTHACLGYTPPP
jgi:hypothetical protein